MKFFDSGFIRYIGLGFTAILVFLLFATLTIMTGLPWWISLFLWFGVIGIFIGVLTLAKERKHIMLKVVARLGVAMASAAVIGLAAWALSRLNDFWWGLILFAMGFIGVLLWARKDTAREKGTYTTVNILIIVVVVTISCFMSASFVKNLNALSDVRREFSKPAIMQGDLLSDVITLDRYRQALLKVEEENRRWWVPRLGLRKSLNVENALKHKFVNLYHRGFLNEFDKTMGERMTRFNANTPKREFGAHVVHLVRRINLLKARLAQYDMKKLAALPQPAYNPDVLNQTNVIQEIQNKLGQQYIHAISWEKDSDALHNEMTRLQTWLKHLLTLPGITLNWLTDRVNADPSLNPLGLHDYWGGKPNYDLGVIPAAFTKAGQTKIHSAIAEIEAALFDPLIIAWRKVEFNKWYHQAYVAAWQEFVQNFDSGSRLLKGRDQWQAVAKRLGTPQGPYYALIDRAVDEFESYGKENQLPPWIALAEDWQMVRKQSAASDNVDLSKSGIIQKATRRVTTKIRQTERAFGNKARKPITPEAQLRAGKAHLSYQTGLDESVKGAASRNVAFKLASELYGQDTATGESPLLSAQRALTEVKAAIGDSTIESEVIFWNLLYGNIRFMQQYITQEAACLLQSRWEKDVLLEIQEVSNQDLNSLLFGTHGFATKFLNSGLAPFITGNSKKGYSPRTVYGLKIPFENKFLEFLSEGNKHIKRTGESFTVFVEGLPTQVNAEAKFKPHITVVEFQCMNGTQKLLTSNLSASNTIKWSTRYCNRVDILIVIGDLLLEKTYDGDKAISDFIGDFEKGYKDFTPDDFQRQKTKLEILNIRKITVKLRFKWHQPVIDYYKKAITVPLTKIPRSIVACWQ